ncbi:MAG: acylphosphatase [Ginsengibacter sp.]
MKTAHLEIEGRVQGVFFRARAKEIAESHEISGWIRNRDDGKVEACISGEDRAVDVFIAWCRHGPENARVENVHVNYMPIEKFDKFQVLRQG